LIWGRERKGGKGKKKERKVKGKGNGRREGGKREGNCNYNSTGY